MTQELAKDVEPEDRAIDPSFTHKDLARAIHVDRVKRSLDMDGIASTRCI